jgi:UPF0716 protein FxsA
VLLKLVLLFVIVPFVELTLLFAMAGRVGALWTLGLIVATGIVGGTLARWQGMQTAWRLREQMSQGQFPTKALADAGMILVAGALLLTPGILTDVFGFSLLIPACRSFYGKRLHAWFKKNVRVTTTTNWTQQREPEIIDAEVVSKPTALREE